MLNRSMPLLLSPALLLSLLLPLGGAADEEAVLGTGRLVLVPVNLGIRPNEEVKEGLEPVWDEILAYFGDSERKVTALERRSASGLWKETVDKLQALGQRDVYAAYSEFAKQIAEQIDYDTIVFPSLVLRAARLDGVRASWDGVRRDVESPLGEAEPVVQTAGSDLFVSNRGLSGEIAAASLHVAVLDSKGELRFEGAGGLTVLQKVVDEEERGGPKLSVARREGAFSDGDELREGIAAAFRQPLPASRAN